MKIYQKLGFFMIGFVFGTAFTLNYYPVVAQEVVEKVDDVSLTEFLLDPFSVSRQEYKNERIEKLMATSTLDLQTATKIDFDSQNTKAITDRLDRIIYFLGEINKTKKPPAEV